MASVSVRPDVMLGMSENENLPPIRDLFDFFQHWPKLRGRVIALRESRVLDLELEGILSWMITLIDRVGPEDLTKTPPRE
ncbi:MAG: hypothetical protein R3D25_15655 [Geminicoccaceae bacterium]